jgi:hypothetical protein
MPYTEDALIVGRRLNKVVVNHSSFVQALEGIGRIIQLGNELGAPRGMCLVAPSGCGKSLLIDLLRTNACGWPFLNPQSILVAALKENPTVSHVQGELLSQFKYPITPKPSERNNSSVNKVLVHAIAHNKIQLTAIDEYQHIFLTRTDGVRRSINDWLKRYMTLTERPILLTGTEELLALENGDPQISTRISSTFRLAPFKHDAEWKGVLKCFIESCPEVDLRSMLSLSSRDLHTASQGVFRNVKQLVVEAAMIAVDDQHKALDRTHLCLAFARVYGAASSRENPFQ